MSKRPRSAHDRSSSTLGTPFRPSHQPHLSLRQPHLHISSPRPLFASSLLPPTSHIPQLHISILAHIMQLTTLLLAAIGAASVSASPSWIPSGGQVVINEDFKVPGDNPLYFCSDPKDDIVQIKKVDLSPNPPVPYVYPRCLQGRLR